MADFTITDRSRGAQNSVQTGLQDAIYVMLQSEISTITFDATTREIDAITMATGKEAYKVDVALDEALLDHPLAGGTSSYGAQTLTFAFDGYTSANKKALDALDANTGICVLAVFANGTRRLVGLEFDSTDSTDPYRYLAKFNAGGDTSGTIADSSTTVTNRMQRTYTWNAKFTPPFVETGLSLSTLTTPAA